MMYFDTENEIVIHGDNLSEAWLEHLLNVIMHPEALSLHV